MTHIEDYAYLDDDETLIVNKVLACALGLNASIVYRQLHFWIKTYRKANKDSHFKDGAWWIYNTYEMWRDDSNFPFWSITTIRRLFKQLESLNLIVSTSEYNAKGYDDTKWYAIDYEAHKQFLAMWHDFGRPNASSKDYKEFIEQWHRSKPEKPLFNLDRGGVQSGQGGVSNLDREGVQSGQTNTRDYTETTKENEEEAPTPSPFKAYEQNIGIITPIIAEQIKSCVDDYPDGWFADAVTIAVTRNKRSIGYVLGILKRWHTDGKDDGKPKSTPNTQPVPEVYATSPFEVQS